VTRLLAIADLRMREGTAARLLWLVLAAFAVGVAAAAWAQGPDAEARVALADRIVLWTTWGIAFAVAAIVPALGLPADVRTGTAQTLLASPASRLEVIAGGTLGYGAFASLLLVAMAGAATLGMQLGGLGGAQREAVRPETFADVVANREGGVALIDASSPAATFRCTIPAGLAPQDRLRVRFAPEERMETGFDRTTEALVSVARPGGPPGTDVRVAFKATTDFNVLLPRGTLAPGDAAEITLRRTKGRWAFTFSPGSVAVGGAPQLYASSLVVAALCAAPLLFMLASIGAVGASRFGAPTAVILASFLFVVFVGGNLVVDGARFIVDAAADRSFVHQDDGHGHDHGHGPGELITPGRVAAAKAVLTVFAALPRYDTFDRTDALVARRAPGWADIGRAAAEGLPAAAVLTLAGWLMLRRREIVPG
jgi:hypothetical protein